MFTKLKSKLGLVKKALYIWAVQYHFVIPKEMLRMYVHKFRHESENISKYDQRFYDPGDPVQYRKWLTMQEYNREAVSDSVLSKFTVMGSGNEGISVPCVSNLSDVKTDYVILCEGKITFYSQFVCYLRECLEYDLTYFDSDLIDGEGERYSPFCRPDFAYDTLRGYNCCGRCVVIKKELLEGYDGNLYLLLLRLSDQIRFHHIPKILYGEREYVKKNESDTVREYLKEKGIAADVIDNPDGESHCVRYCLDSYPKITIMIPTKDGKNVLKVCIDSILEKTDYPDYEIRIIDNNSEKQETFDYFHELERGYDNIHVMRLECPFNFSYLNNRCAEKAEGEYLVLLNNDTSVVDGSWLKDMVSYASRPEVGSVGVLLYYPDDSIQHGGVISGKGGAAAHRYYRAEKPVEYGYTLTIPNDVSCCTAACLMVPKKKYMEVGMMNEELTVQFNDVDLGLRLYEAGYFNVFLPYVKLYHYESKSRGMDRTKEEMQRFMYEVNYAKEKWGKYIAHDPFYSDNFDKNYDFQLIVGTGSN